MNGLPLEIDSAPVIQPLKKHTGIAIPMLLNNIDTDQIIPSREMKKVSKTGLSEGLFAGQRYLQIKSNNRELNPDFVLNKAQYREATILLSCKNFGCGSSREHAVWAMLEYGFRIIIAESFGTIFRTNCLRNGILPIALKHGVISKLSKQTIADPVNNTIDVDVANKLVTSPNGECFGFELESHFQEMLLGGLDFISLTMKREKQINSFIQQDKLNRAWAHLK